MDRVDVRKYIEENRVRFSRGRQLPRRHERIRRRPRTQESYAILSSIVSNRWRLWLERGWIEILGPRRYRINLPESRDKR